MTNQNGVPDDSEALLARLHQQIDEIKRFTDALIQSGKFEIRPLSIEQKKQLYLDGLLATDRSGVLCMWRRQ